MCGRYSEVEWDELYDWLNLIEQDRAVREHPYNDDVRPTTKQLVVIKTERGLEPVTMRWGLVPFFHRKPLKEWKATTFNARAETVAMSGAFKSAFARRRCLVPVKHFYEWTGPKGSKVKHAISTKGNEPGLVFAGIWDRTTTPDEGEVRSFAIVTHGSEGSPMADYHDRAPLTLFGEDRMRWLDTEADVSDLLKTPCGDIYKFEQAA